MAGLGRKVFSTGDVLTATDFQGYAVDQSVMVFADTSARDTALSAVVSEGMFAFAKDTDTLYYYDVQEGDDLTIPTSWEGRPE